MTHHRPQRVADQIREVLAQLLREEIRDPEIGFVTVTDVDLTADLRHARVYVSVLGDEAASLGGLRRAGPYLRRALARQARLRFTPELRFVIDRSAATGSRVESLLADLRRAEPTRPAPDDSASDDET